jgi:hypothetical protein
MRGQRLFVLPRRLNQYGSFINGELRPIQQKAARGRPSCFRFLIGDP